MGAEISAGAAQMEALEAAKTVFLRIHYNGTHRCVVTDGFTSSSPFQGGLNDADG